MVGRHYSSQTPDLILANLTCKACMGDSVFHGFGYCLAAGWQLDDIVAVEVTVVASVAWVFLLVVDVFFLLPSVALPLALGIVFSSFIGDLLSLLYQPGIDNPRRCR